MKRKFCSLFCSMLIFMMCNATCFSANVEIPALEPIERFQDFENESIIVAEGYTDDEIEAMTGVPVEFVDVANAENPVSASIIQEESGNKLLKLVTTHSAQQINSVYELNTPLETGKLEASFEFLSENTNATIWYFFNIANTSGTGPSVLSYQSGIWTKSTTMTDGELKSTPVKNTEGRYVLRVEVSRVSASEAWTIRLYDESSGNSVLRFEGKTAEDFGAIKSIRPIRQYAQETGTIAYVDNYLIRTTAYPSVLPEDDGLSGAAPDAESMTIGFNGALPNPEDEVIIVEKENPEIEIETETSYDATSGRLTVAPQSFLSYKTDYVLKFKNGGVSNHNFRTMEAPLSVVSKTYSYTQLTPAPSSATDIIPEDGTFNAEASIKIANTTNTPMHVLVAFIAYDENGAVVRALSRNANIPANRSNGYPVNMTFANLDSADVDSVKAFVLKDAGQSGYLPIG